MDKEEQRDSSYGNLILFHREDRPDPADNVDSSRNSDEEKANSKSFQTEPPSDGEFAPLTKNNTNIDRKVNPSPDEATDDPETNILDQALLDAENAETSTLFPSKDAVVETPSLSLSPSLLSEDILPMVDARPDLLSHHQSIRLVPTAMSIQPLNDKQEHASRIVGDLYDQKDGSSSGENTNRIQADQLLQSDPSLEPQQPTTSRAALISVKFQKQNKTDKLGIGFRMQQSRLDSSRGGAQEKELLVASLSPNGILADAPLLPGDILWGMGSLTRYQCGKACWTHAQVAQYLRETEGSIQLTVQNLNGEPHTVQASVYKSTKHEKVGIKFHSKNHSLQISKISPNKLLGAHSILQVGDYVLSINGQACDEGMASEEATSIIQNTTGWVHILVCTQGIDQEITVREADDDIVSVAASSTPCAEASVGDLVESRSRRLSAGRLEPFEETVVAEQVLSTRNGFQTDLLALDGDLEAGLPGLSSSGSAPQPCFMSVRVFKTRGMNDDLGIALARDVTNPSGPWLLSRLAAGSLIDGIGLEIGFQVLSINDIRTSDWQESQEAEDFLRDLEGVIQIVAQNPRASSSGHVQAVAYKVSPRDKIGVVLQASPMLQISSIASSSIFAHSVLNEGDQVISINGVDCLYATPSDAVRLIEQSPTQMSIVAKTCASAAIVVGRGVSQLENQRLRRNRRVRHVLSATLWFAMILYWLLS